METENNKVTFTSSIGVEKEYKESEITQGETDLPLIWRMILFSDGSNTRNLQNITKNKAVVSIISEKNEAIDDLDMKRFIYDWKSEFEKQGIKNLIQREIYMDVKEKDSPVRLMKAVSIWNRDAYEQQMKEKSQAIGMNLIQNKVEYFRENLRVIKLSQLQESNEFLKGENCTMGRGYLMHNKGQIMCYIEEYFYPILENYLLK